jgi:hypothetical protein
MFEMKKKMMLMTAAVHMQACLLNEMIGALVRSGSSSL